MENVFEVSVSLLEFGIPSLRNSEFVLALCKQALQPSAVVDNLTKRSSALAHGSGDECHQRVGA